MCRRPESVLRLNDVAVNVPSVQTAVLEARDNYDAFYATPNNWKSVLLSGLAENPAALEWMAIRVQQVRADGMLPD